MAGLAFLGAGLASSGERRNVGEEASEGLAPALTDHPQDATIEGGLEIDIHVGGGRVYFNLKGNVSTGLLKREKLTADGRLVDVELLHRVGERGDNLVLVDLPVVFRLGRRIAFVARGHVGDFNKVILKQERSERKE